MSGRVTQLSGAHASPTQLSASGSIPYIPKYKVGLCSSKSADQNNCVTLDEFKAVCLNGDYHYSDKECIYNKADDYFKSRVMVDQYGYCVLNTDDIPSECIIVDTPVSPVISFPTFNRN